jgi:hypothetical protein
MAFGMLGLTLAMLAVLFCLIVVIESAVLQFLNWGDLRCSLRTALRVNLFTAPPLLILLGLTPAFGAAGLWTAWAICTLAEGLLLARQVNSTDRRRDLSRGLVVALIANLASFLVLLLPAYLSSL